MEALSAVVQAELSTLARTDPASLTARLKTMSFTVAKRLRLEHQLLDAAASGGDSGSDSNRLAAAAVGTRLPCTRDQAATALAAAAATHAEPPRYAPGAGAMVVCVSDGLCNRLRVALSYAQVARQHGRRLVVLWRARPSAIAASAGSTAYLLQAR